MAKVQIKSEKLTPFGGIFSIMEQFDSNAFTYLSTRHLVRDAAVSSDTSTAKLFVL
mgnify:CR=1 FL=1